MNINSSKPKRNIEHKTKSQGSKTQGLILCLPLFSGFLLIMTCLMYHLTSKRS